MVYIKRKIYDKIKQSLERGKSILLLGPRQTGKTTFIINELSPDIYFTLVEQKTRIKYEKNISLFEQELDFKIKEFTKINIKPPLIFIDEIQKIPRLMDTVQYLIDKKAATFILSGSSARKLKHGSDINLLPGRVINLIMDPLSYDELKDSIKPKIEDILIYGTLPEIILEEDDNNKNEDLATYVTLYLEEEVRAEALVRKIGDFARFLELSAAESGNIINHTKLSQEIGVASSTIADYFQILEDCMIITRIDPISKTTTKRRLVKSPKYLFFDLGLRRASAEEGTNLPISILSKLFEQYVGLELHRIIKLDLIGTRLKYWRDQKGAEIDYIIETPDEFIPIEVKWTEAPKEKDIRHLKKFNEEYSTLKKINYSYVICRCDTPFEISKNIFALPWQNLSRVFKN